MSQTATTFDPRVALVEQIDSAASKFVSDLKHIPADKLTVSPGGVARPPLTFTAECIGFNNMIADMLAGVEVSMPDPETIEKFFASIDTLEKGVNGIEASAAKVKSALQQIEPAVLEEQAMAPWGEPMTKGTLTAIAASHMVYHDGQLNYIQALYGDGAMHWHD